MNLNLLYEKNKTVIRDTGSIPIPVSILVKYLEEILWIKVNCTKTGDVVIKGVYREEELKGILQKFIQTVVLCPKCNFKVKCRKSENVYKLIVECTQDICRYFEKVDVIESRESKMWKIVYFELQGEN